MSGMPRMVRLGERLVPMLAAKDVCAIAVEAHEAKLDALKVRFAEHGVSDAAKAEALSRMEGCRGSLEALWDWCRTITGAVKVIERACSMHGVSCDDVTAGLGPGQVCDLAIDLIYPPAVKGGAEGKALDPAPGTG